ncbi:hypothetical protein JQN72_07780 [Phycicoccus sp. CSK15P-2]|uniref:hypothetical protein n=1 Tax=Phycicoccus sp. CSK15P-2 TaxID=2807627 RepID=UPI0019522B65|nr:hypothetical protein [Phycicoccus sp. CSK15P-2]MBM6404142.1 hypothetical protein [Phycicoccus sp. CSK15P-2]
MPGIHVSPQAGRHAPPPRRTKGRTASRITLRNVPIATARRALGLRVKGLRRLRRKPLIYDGAAVHRAAAAPIAPLRTHADPLVREVAAFLVLVVPG